MRSRGEARVDVEEDGAASRQIGVPFIHLTVIPRGVSTNQVKSEVRRSHRSKHENGFGPVTWNGWVEDRDLVSGYRVDISVRVQSHSTRRPHPSGRLMGRRIITGG